jgi:hypothetical protein
MHLCILAQLQGEVAPSIGLKLLQKLAGVVPA